MSPPTTEETTSSVPASLPVTEEQVEKIGAFLRNESNPLKGRFRALFTLRNINTPLAIKLIGECFADPSALLKHELAYCLGQMQSKEAVPILSSVLSNMQEHPMVRHEAGTFNDQVQVQNWLNELKVQLMSWFIVQL
jgi:HEAT repeat protein